MKFRIARVLPAILIFTQWTVGPRESKPQSSQTTYEVRSQLVQIYLTVTEGTRRVTDLTESDITIKEDGQPAEIHRFDTGEFPLQIALLLDTSESMRGALAVTQDAAVSFVESLKPSDRVTLINFNTDIRHTLQLTDDREPILHAIRNSQARGGTKFYDALLFGMKQLSRKEGKKAIVTFSDGHDTAQSASLELVLNAAARYGYPIYSIGAGAGLQREQLKRVLRQIAEINSGRTYYVEDLHNLRAAFKEVTTDLRSAYVLNYYTKVPYDGRWHDVDIIPSNPQYRMHHRKGFYARSVQFNTLYADAADPGPRKSMSVPTWTGPDPAKVAQAARAASEEIITLPIPEKEIETQSIRDAIPVKPETSEKKTPTFKVETRFIEVPLLVESLNGKEIPILSKEDFRVYEDETPREITFFSDEIAAGGITKLRDAAVKRMQESNLSIPLSHAADPQDLILGRVYLMLDDLSAAPGTFLNIRRAAEKIILEQYTPLRPLSLHLASDSSANVLASDDTETLLEKVRRAVPRAGGGTVSEEEVMSTYEAHIIDDGDRIAADVAELRLASTLGLEHNNESGAVEGDEPLDPDQVEREIPRITQQIISLNYSKTFRVINGLSTVVNAAAADPARYPKTIIFLSPGLMIDRNELSGMLRPIIDRANRNGIRISTVDALGLADIQPLEPRSNPRFLLQNPQLLSVLHSHASGFAMERQSILHKIARDTGGQFLHSTNDLVGAAATAVRTTCSVYYLGYISEQPLDGRYHRIRVTSSARTARIHARQGYFATEKSSPETLAETSVGGEDWQTLIVRAKEAAALGDASVLVPTLEQLVRKFPNEANLWYNLGVAHFKQGHGARAIETLQRGFALAPFDKDIGAALSRALMTGGHPEAAAETVTELIRRHPSDANLLINLGRIYEASSRTAEAYRVYRRLLDFGLSLPADAYLALVRTSASLGRQIEASLFIRDYLARGGDEASIQPWIGMLAPDPPPQ